MADVLLDGSYGEGGGQILRTALALSLATGQSLEVVNIRAGRKKPGLAAQHLGAVNAAQAISNASVEGASLGSQTLRFAPGRLVPGSHFFNIGTAGSALLLFQTIFVPLAVASAPSTATITGGTHVPWSPPFEYVSEVFLRAAETTGLCATLSMEACGFYPQGGGRIVAEVRPITHVRPVLAEHRGELVGVRGVVGLTNLPEQIAHRMQDYALQALRAAGISARIEIALRQSPGPGCYIVLVAEYQGCVAGFSSLGERGKRAEIVAQDAVGQLLAFHATGACVDSHLADQLLLPAALSAGESRFTVSRVTQHLVTNAWTIGRFLPVKVSISGEIGQPGTVVCRPS